MKQLAQDHSGHSREVSCMLQQHPAHPSSSQKQGALVPPMQRDLCCTTEATSSSRSGCKHACRENRLPSSGKGRLPNIFFLNYYFRHSEVAHVPSAIHPPCMGPPAADQTFYSCQEKVCCRKGETSENQQVLLHFGLQGSERRGHKKGKQKS